MRELTINGYKLGVKPISPLAPKSVEVQYKKKHPQPQPPMYEIEAVGGVTESFPHTRETVETTEEKEALLEYESKLSDWTADLSYKLMRLFLSQGVELSLTKKQEQEFKEQLEVLDIDIPESKPAQNILFLETFIIGSQNDMEKISQAILAETGIDQEVLEVAEATFPD